MVVMASDGPSPHSPSLRLGRPGSCPPVIETPPRPVPAGPLILWPKNASCSRIPPEQAAPLSRRDNERRHAVGSHSALALRLYLAACHFSSSCRVWVLIHLWSNLSQSFHFCRITEIWSLNLCVRFYLFLFCLCFSDINLIELNFSFNSLFAISSLSPERFHCYFHLNIVSWQYQKFFNHTDTCAVPSV